MIFYCHIWKIIGVAHSHFAVLLLCNMIYQCVAMSMCFECGWMCMFKVIWTPVTPETCPFGLDSYPSVMGEFINHSSIYFSLDFQSEFPLSSMSFPSSVQET